ncbi:MAG: sigma-54-dependent Fis family transcriptional regulator [Planctomycetota bacterium]
MSRILLIEDEQSAQLLYRNRLEDLGHEVVVAPTGARGLMEARSGSFDLFLVDVVLGSGIDGFEVCKRIKTIPQMQGIPVVLISGQLKGREDLHRGYEAGCEAFLIKGDLPLMEDVVRAMLNVKALQDDLAIQNQLLEEQNRRLTEERQRGADLELALRETGNRSLVFRELAAGRPDGLLLVDSEGIVRFADRGAIDVLGKDLEGRNLGSLAPASGLEAFVRDARNEPREGYRFDISIRAGQISRALSASVLPIVPVTGQGESGLRAVLLLDAGRRKVASEMLRLQEQGVPRREIGPLLEAARASFHPRRLLGRSEPMVNLRRRVAKAASSEKHVLVRGGEGAGKELVARALHFGGTRSGAFVPVNCAALATDVLESELFGHAKGAFEGAISDRPGLFQQAHLGTVFLDEIQELASELQEKIVRVLEDGEVRRVGSSKAEYVDVRVIAATSSSLEDAVREGGFREDLHARLNVVDLMVPLLRDRPGDVELLARDFLSRFAPERDTMDFSPDTLRVLEAYHWPGNVRELENCIERACALVEGDAIEIVDLPQPLRELASGMASDLQIPSRRPEHEIAGTHSPLGSSQGGYVATVAVPPSDEVSLENFEKKCLLEAMKQTNGDKLAAAKLLKVGKSTLYRKLKTHGIT